MRAARLFISYASADAHWKDKIINCCAALRHAGRVEFWFDRKIAAGEEWEKEIFDRIAWADGALLLISENFIVSNFIIKRKLPVFQEKYNKMNISYPASHWHIIKKI